MLLEKLERVPWEEYFDLDMIKSNLLCRESESQQRYLEEELEAAKKEWQEARQYFNLVSDPDLVEHAIYLLEAAEKKYNYLLKQKKKKRESS